MSETVGEPVRVDARGARAADVDLAPCVGHLRGRGIVLHPTETVYGLGCRLQPEALHRLSVIKGREAAKPFLLLLPGPEAASGLDWTESARELARIFWPGPLTLLLSDPEGWFPPEVRGPHGTVGVRVTSHPLTARLVSELGEPMTSTSANLSGAPAARSVEGALAGVAASAAAGELLLLDVGPLPERTVSTIVDCTGPEPSVVRPGATPLERLRCVIPDLGGPAALDPPHPSGDRSV